MAFQAKVFPAKRKRGQSAVDDDDDDDNASGTVSLHQSALKLDTSKVSKPFKAHAASASSSLHSSSAAASFSSSSFDSSASSRAEPTAISKALHDPFAAGALILNSRAAALRVNDASAMSDSTDSAVSATYSTDGSTGKAQVPIVVDPYVCKHLRPHQRSGVQFIYDCITGQRGENAGGEDNGGGGGGVRQFGCILADEMGLGKSLMTIALLWTLLRQGPNGPAHPLIRRALVVVPATLVDNWSREFQKWLGRERLGVVALSSGAKADEQAGMVRDFCVKSSTGAIASPVLVLSYESLRKHCEALRGCAEIGLIVCDEGHRLKNAGSKTVELLNSMPAKRRVLLTGTPVQNNLEELFGMCQVFNFFFCYFFADIFILSRILLHDFHFFITRPGRLSWRSGIGKHVSTHVLSAHREGSRPFGLGRRPRVGRCTRRRARECLRGLRLAPHARRESPPLAAAHRTSRILLVIPIADRPLSSRRTVQAGDRRAPLGLDFLLFVVIVGRRRICTPGHDIASQDLFAPGAAVGRGPRRRARRRLAFFGHARPVSARLCLLNGKARSVGERRR
jgi:hypothetical protein